MNKKINWSRRKIIRKTKMKNLGIVKLVGVDTETISGEPHTIQYFGEKINQFNYVTADNITPKFIEFIDEQTKDCDTLLVYGFNYRFDLPVIFFEFLENFQTEDCFEFLYEGYRIFIVYAQNTFAILKGKDKFIAMIDIRNFFRNGSLDDIAEKFKLPIRKLEKPKDLGKRLLTLNDIPYAMRDAEIAYELGKIIYNYHIKQNFTQITYSCAHFAELDFRQHYLEKEIKLPDKNITEFALQSYHGGRNFYKYDKPKVFYNCFEYDLKSAYAWAMSKLPDFADGKYELFDSYKADYPYSIIKCDFNKNELPDNLIFDDSKYLNNKNKNKDTMVWITKYEFDIIRKYLPKALNNIYKQISYIPYNKRNSPLNKFVNDHYTRKRQADIIGDTVFSEMEKLTMNSLYGKFIQTIAKDDYYYFDENNIIQHKVEWVAGGLFHPYIATLITGLVRAVLIESEFEYNAFHSSTDSIKTEKRIITGTELGNFELKCWGDCIILRNRLYIHYDKQGNIAKWAGHGFKGKAELLEQIIYEGKTKFDVNRILMPKEARRRSEKPLDMIKFEQELSLEFTQDFLDEAKWVIEKNRTLRKEKNGKNN